MNKYLLALVLPIAGASVSASAQEAGTIDFQGEILASTCAISPADVSKIVTLPKVGPTSLASAGDVAGDVGFDINVGGTGEVGCTDGRSAYVRFDPASALLDRASGRLNINAGADAAQNLQVELLNSDGSNLNMYTSGSVPVIVADNRAVIRLIARYRATGAVVPGLVSSNIGFQVHYN